MMVHFLNSDVRYDQVIENHEGIKEVLEAKHS